MEIKENNKFLVGMFLIMILLIGFLIYFSIPKTNEGGRKDIGIGRAPPMGNPNAKIKIITFSDFQCPACKASHPIIDKIFQDYQEEVVLYYRSFPLSMHENSFIAAEAAECANEQGKFWKYHDILFENQNNLYKENLKEYAANIGLNEEQFNLCLDNEKYKEEILSDIAESKKLNLRGTPTFFINGREVFGVNEKKMREIIEDEI